MDTAWVEQELDALKLDGGHRVAVREALLRAEARGRDRGTLDVWEAKEGTVGGRREARRRRAVVAEEATEGSELARWWVTMAEDEIHPMIEKMREYGGRGRALDLEEIGRGLVKSGVHAGPLTSNGEPQEGWYQELGVYFYMLGKFARWTAAVAEGRPVSDDTLHDISIYVRMAQRIRNRGGWPV